MIVGHRPGCGKAGLGRRAPWGLAALSSSFLLLLAACQQAWAHGPLWISHYEVPGKETLDLHTGVHQGEGLEVEQGIGFGISRTLGLEIEAPIYRNKSFQVREAMAGLTWRVWNQDGPQSKNSVIAKFHTQFHNQTDVQTREQTFRLDYSLGLGMAVERILWAGMGGFRLEPGGSPETTGGAAAPAAAQSQISVQDAGHAQSGPGQASSRALWAEGALGYRFLRLDERQIDAMLFVATGARLSGSRSQFVAPQLLFQPNRWMLLKGGYRFPVGGTGLNGGWGYEMEVRF